MITVTIPSSIPVSKAMTDAPATVKAELTKAVQSSIIYLQGLVRDQAPVKTGKLRASVTAAMLPDAVSGTVSVPAVSDKGAPYPIYVHEGTGQYAVNQSLTTGRIKHGGIKPNPFMDRAITMADPQITLYFAGVGDAVISSIVGAL